MIQSVVVLRFFLDQNFLIYVFLQEVPFVRTNEQNEKRSVRLRTGTVTEAFIELQNVCVIIYLAFKVLHVCSTLFYFEIVWNDTSPRLRLASLRRNARVGFGTLLPVQSATRPRENTNRVVFVVLVSFRNCVPVTGNILPFAYSQPLLQSKDRSWLKPLPHAVP